MNFIKYLKELQTRTGLSQNKFAVSVGVSPTVISKIYNKKRKPTARFILKVCDSVGHSTRAYDFLKEL